MDGENDYETEDIYKSRSAFEEGLDYTEEAYDYAEEDEGEWNGRGGVGGVIKRGGEGWCGGGT